MPRPPRVSDAVESIRGSAFSALAHRLASVEGETYPLHVGDTWMAPPEGCRMEDLRAEEHPGMNRYASPRGRQDLRTAIAERMTRRTGVATGPDDVLVTAGATGACACAIGAVCDPGERILIPAPYWPLIAGIARAYRVEPVIVPLPDATISGDSGNGAGAGKYLERLDDAFVEGTVALYLNTPNNPTGRVISEAVLRELVGWARERELWILSDEVYEDYVFDGDHTYCRRLGPERTISVHSFSKAFGMAGDRVGYAVGPAEVMPELCKIGTHAYYCSPTPSQIAALEALGDAGERWVRSARRQYRQLGEYAADRLGLPRPSGSTFLFFDVAERLDDRGLMGLLEDCVDRGLLLAPGPSFGPYPDHVRLCFTSARPELVRRGVGVLADLLGR